MRRIYTLSGWCGAVAVLLTTAAARPGWSIYLDEDQNFQLRARIYSRYSTRIENSAGDTVPDVKAGQMVEHRNFFHPELEGKLTPLLPDWLGGFKPDDLSFRLTAWGFYDGIYDWGPRQFSDQQRRINAGYPEPLRLGAFYLEGDSFQPLSAAGVRQPNLDAVFPHNQVQNPRDIYGTRRRLNEAYVNFSKGPFFLRVGKQAISWGESDTIALLDANNPFDLTLGVPGIFQDIEEARIPLWTIRTSLTLFDTLGPFSSGFVEAYWVPGEWDINTGILPVLTASPYSAPRLDPQQTLRDTLGSIYDAVPVQFVLQDLIPERKFDRSRYGFRVQTVINRFFTTSAWMYTTFPNQPVGLSQGLTRLAGTNTSLFVTQTLHNKSISVYGLANTFFLEPIDSIIRMEVEWFDNEPGFVPELNLGVNQSTASNPLGVLTNCNRTVSQGKSVQKCYEAKADVLRWELGLDRFFFIRALNPTNSFTFVTAVVGSWNTDEGKTAWDPVQQESIRLDYRMIGQTKPGATGNSPDDFVQLKRVEAFGQIRLQTDYMHGRLNPGITYIQNARGTWVVNPSVTYRMRDWLLFDLSAVFIGGEYQQAGFFRDRDQIAARVTWQLN
jgi:hypothetical protein